MSKHAWSRRKDRSSCGQCLLLGLTGGIATGKSTVAEMLVELGADHIDFDLLSRLVVAPGQPALSQIRAQFGNQVLTADGRLNRKKMSALVFEDQEKRRQLEKITHPAIHAAYLQQIEALTDNNPEATVVASVPLLIEVNMQSMFDKILVVYASPEQQIRRLIDRDHISIAAATKIIDAQLPIDDKLDHADFVIRNAGDLADTRRQVEQLWNELQELQAGKGN